MSARHHVVVIGAGYAGMQAANRTLSTDPDTDVTVINPRPVFVERVRLHQLAAGTGSATHELTELLHPRATVRVARAIRIRDDAVDLDDGTSVAFDAAVYAVGSGPGVPDVPGGEHAFSVSDLESATALHDVLAAAADGTAVTVVGAGATGTEVASEIAESHPQLTVTLVGEAGAALPEGTRRYLHRTLDTLGVRMRGGIVTEITDDAVSFDDGTREKSDVTVWAGGFSVPTLARDSGLPVDDAGRLRVDATLRPLGGDRIAGAGGDRIVGVGDAVRVEGHDYIRMSCQAAMPLGKHGADTVAALLHGRAPEALSLQFVALCISLGRRRGAVQIMRSDDTPRNLAVKGRAGALTKEAVVRGTMWDIRRNARRGVGGGANESGADRAYEAASDR